MMNSLKYTMLTLLFMLVTTVGFAQQSKMQEKAQAKVVEMNNLLKKGNPNAALTEAQEKQIYEIQMARLNEIAKTKKEVTDKEALKPLVKAINKKHFKKIFQDVLTKEQREANKAAKAKK